MELNDDSDGESTSGHCLWPSSWALIKLFGSSVPEAPHSRLGRSRQSAREGAYPSQSQQHTTANSLEVLSLLK